MNLATIEVDCRLFVGESGGDAVTFACVRGGGYAVLRNGRPVEAWDGEQVEAGLNAYLDMIERPVRPLWGAADDVPAGAASPSRGQ